MFENGSLLRRRKRFKLHKADKELLENELAALSTMNRMMQQQQQQQQQQPPNGAGADVLPSHEVSLQPESS